jgi:hypothetical protein
LPPFLRLLNSAGSDTLAAIVYLLAGLDGVEGRQITKIWRRVNTLTNGLMIALARL